MEERELSSLELAYGLSIESYKLAQERFFHLDNNLQVVMTMALQVTLIFPLAVGAFGLELEPISMFLAIATFVILMGFGFYARFFSAGLATIDSRALLQKYLDKSPNDFREDVIHFSGEHFTGSSTAANNKEAWLNAMCLLFAFEIVFLCASLALPGLV